MLRVSRRRPVAEQAETEMVQTIATTCDAACPPSPGRALRWVLALVSVVLSTACGWGAGSAGDSPADREGAVRLAHEAYVAAINSNRADQWMATVAEDVVYLVPNQAAIVGRGAVGAWASRYLQEVTTHWTKSVEEWQVSGDWAFGRYVYTASDSLIIYDPSTEGGGTANDSGWGLIIYHRGDDGRWLVARDAWGSDRPAR